jgi:hypothetical protein
MQPNPTLNAMASGPGSTGDLPFLFGLDNSEPNYSNDDPTDVSAPSKISSGKQTYAVAYRNKSWSTMDMARELGLEDPLGGIINRVGKYWSVDDESRLINTCMGIKADNVANDNGDMTVDISTDDGDNATDSNEISANALIDAGATMGDHAGTLAGIAMHSMQFTKLQKENLIDTIPDSEGRVAIPTYQGKVVIVDDSLVPVPGATSGFVYTVILFSMGAVAFGQGTPTVPSEMDRSPSTGGGGGQDILYSRATDIIHPYGFAFDTSGVAGISATYAELNNSAAWNRVYQYRKNVGIAFLVCN